MLMQWMDVFKRQKPSEPAVARCWKSAVQNCKKVKQNTQAVSRVCMHVSSQHTCQHRTWLKTDLRTAILNKAGQQGSKVLRDDVLMELPVLHITHRRGGCSLLCSLQNSLQGFWQSLCQAVTHSTMSSCHKLRTRAANKAQLPVEYIPQHSVMCCAQQACGNSFQFLSCCKCAMAPDALCKFRPDNRK